MSDLLDRLRAATEPDRELWVEVFDRCAPPPETDAELGELAEDYVAWRDMGRRFCNLLAVEAYLDAALLLMPPIGDLKSGPGCAWALYAGWLGTSLKNVAPGYSVHVDIADAGYVTREIRTDRTSHPALALAIAALEARGG